MTFLHLEKNIKEALKAKDTCKVVVLRLVKNRSQQIAKESNCEIDENIIEQAAKKEMKQLNQTIDSLAGTGRELYFQSIRQKQILEDYMPKQLSEEELANTIKVLLKGSENESFGVKMKIVMSSLQGKADGKIISRIIKSL